MPGDLEFNLTGNPAELIAAIQRVTELASRMGAGSVNLQKVFDDAAKGAKTLAGATAEARISSEAWNKQSKLTSEQLLVQQAQIRKLEQAIRAIRDLPLASPQQLTQLRTLEQLYSRLVTSTGRPTNTSPFRPETFSLATTNVQRFIAELKGLDRQLVQLDTLGKQIKLFSKPGVDPAIIASLNQLRDTITQTGALGKSAWNQIQASVRATAADVKDVTQAELEDARISGQRASARARDQARLRQEQAAAARQAQVDQEKLGAQINAILRRREADTAAEERAASRRAAAAERALSAEARASNQRAAAANREAADLNRIEALLARANKLRQTPAVQAFTGRLEGVAAGIGGGGTGPTRAELTALQGEMAALSRVTPIARSGLDALFGSFGRYVRIAASLTVTYGAMRAVMAQITFLSDLDAAMNKIAATMETQAEQAAKLPNSYALISTAMTKFGLSAEDAGSLVLELNRSLDGNVKLINGAFLPAIALTTSGEVNQAEAVRTLVGIYNSYGAALLGATEPLEAMSNISDKILRASDLSVGSVGTFSQALTYLAASASNSNLTIDQTLTLLTLIQDSLGKASQSGTGLARVLEAITNNAQQISEAFNIAFNPSGPVDVIKLMSGLVGQLKKEIDDLGGISQETAQKLQKFVPTEQGTRQIQRLIESFDQYEARLKKIEESSGRNARQIEARNKSLGVSFQSLLNSVMFAVDGILEGLSKIGGGEGAGGGPGQYAATARVLRGIADVFEVIASGSIKAGTEIGKFTTTYIYPLGRAFTWVGEQIESMYQKLTGVKVPDEVWRILEIVRNVAIGAGVGFAAAGPAGAIAAGASAGYATVFDQMGRDARTAKKSVEELTKEIENAQKAEQAMGGGVAPTDKQQTEASIARKTAFDIADRARRIKDIETESRLDTEKNNQQLVMTERLAVAQGALAVSSQRYSEARARFADRSLLGEKDLEDATKALQKLESQRAQDQAKVSSIRFEMQRAEIAQLEEIRKLTQDIMLATTSDNAFDQIFNKSAAELENRMAQIRQKVKEGTLQKGFAETQLAQVQELVRIDLTKAMQGVYDTIVTPFRDASEASIAEIDKIVEAAKEAARRIPNLSEAARGELADVAGRKAGEQFAGVPDAELELRQSIATMGLYGAAAQEATALASKGFTNWTDAIIAANKALKDTGAEGLAQFLAGVQKATTLRMDALLVKLQGEALKTSKALDVLFASASGDEFDLAGNLRALDDTGQTIAELGQSADATRRQLGAMYQLLVETARTQAFGEKIIPQIRELDRAIAGAVASQTQFGAAAIATETAYANFGKSIDQVEPKFRALIEQYAKLAQVQKELATRRGLVGIGFSDEDAARMAAVLSNFEQYLGDLNQGVAALEALNTASERWVTAELNRAQQLARQSNDWISFISAAMAKATAETGNYWKNLETLGTGVIQNLSSSFSDILFAGIKRDAKAAQDAVKNFFLAVARQITDFLASQAVGELKGLFTSLAGGKAGTISVSTSSSGALGSSPSRPVYVSGADINRPVGTGGTDYFGDVISQPAASGGGFNITAPAVSPYALVNGFEALKAGWSALTETGSLMAGYEAAKTSYTAATAAAGDLASAVGTLTAVVGIAVGTFNLLSDAYSKQLTSKSGALSGLSIGAGVGTLISPGIGTIIGAAVGAAAGALAPYIPGVSAGGGRAVGSVIAGPINSDLFRKFGLGDTASMAVASLLNPLGALGDLFEKLFGKASMYDEKRAAAADEANKALQGLSETYRSAARSVDPNQVLGVLRAGQGGGGANNSVRSNLSLDPILAQTVGIQGQIVGSRIIAQWSEVTEQQFKNLLDYFKDNPDSLAQSIAGSGDVPYLSGEDAQKIADQAKAAAENLIKLYTAFKAATDKTQDLADIVVDTATAFLPPDLAERFERGIVKPLQDKIKDTLTSGLPLDEMTVQLTLLGSTLDSYAKLITLYGQLTLDFATLTGDYVKQLGYVRSQVELAREGATKAVEAGAGLFGVTKSDVATIDSGALDEGQIVDLLQHAVDAAALSPELTVKNFQAIRDAVYARFELEKKLIGETEARIKDMYETHGKALVALTQTIATLEINATGTSQTMTVLLTHLRDLGASSLSVSEKMYAANTAFKALLDTLPALISGPGRITDPRHAPSGGLPVEQIFHVAAAGLGPFLATLNTMIADALTSGDLETALGLIEQSGQAIVDVMNAAVAGVRQWESEEIARINESSDAQKKTIEDARDGALEYWEDVEQGINAQLKSIGLEKRGLQDRLDGLNREKALIQRATDAQVWLINLKIYDLNLQKKGIQAQIELWQDQADVLQGQLKVLQDQVSLVQEWASAVESLGKYILSLSLSNQAPPDAVGQFQIAQSRFDSLFKDFKNAPTAKKLQDLQSAASDLITAMGNLFQRPSAEYRELYEKIVKRLEKALNIGEGFGTPATLDDLNEQIKAVESQLDAVNGQIATLNKSMANIDKKISALNDTSAEIQHAAELQLHELELQSIDLEDQIAVLERQEVLLQRQLEDIGDEKARITKAYEDWLTALEDARDKQIEATHDAADAQVKVITDQMLPLIEAARKATADLLDFIRNTNYQLLLDLTGGQGSAAWMKRATENTEAWIGAILQLLSAKLSAPLVVTTAQTPGEADPLITTLNHVDSTLQHLDQTIGGLNFIPGVVGSNPDGGFAAGTMSVPETGVYQMHQKEVVIPMPAAEQFRREVMHWNNLGASLSRSTTSGNGSTGNVVIAPNVNINGLVEAAVVRVIEDDIRRDGPVRRAVQRVLVGR